MKWWSTATDVATLSLPSTHYCMHWYTVPYHLGDNITALEPFQHIIDAAIDDWHARYPHTKGYFYLTLDERRLTPNMYHRRNGVHFDGVWEPGFASFYPEHPIAPAEFLTEQDSGPYGMYIITNILGSCAYEGEVEAEPHHGGDASMLRWDKMKKIDLLPSKLWWLPALALHQSLPMTEECIRTFFRVAVSPYDWRIHENQIRS